MQYHNNSMSTNSEDFKDDEHRSSLGGNENSSSLTASDFELLNSENFFDKVQEAFQNF